MLAGHGIEKAVEAVDDEQLQIVLLDQLPDLVNKLAGRDFRGIDLAKEELSAVDMLSDVHPEAFRPNHQGGQGFIEGEEGGTAVALDRGGCIANCDGGFPATGGPQQE